MEKIMEWIYGLGVLSLINEHQRENDIKITIHNINIYI